MPGYDNRVTDGWRAGGSKGAVLTVRCVGLVCTPACRAQYGETPLSMACQQGHLDVMSELLKNAADVNLASKVCVQSGRLALSYGCTISQHRVALHT